MVKARAIDKGEKSRRRTKASSIIDMEEAQRTRRQLSYATKKGYVSVRESENWAQDLPDDQPVPKEKRKRLLTGKRILCLGIVIATIALISFPIFKVHGLRQEEAEAIKTLNAKEEKKERLERELSMVTDPKYIETQARETLRMIKAGETLYIFETEKGAVADASA
ncbi:MAG: septum formation initiator family protein [Clostridiales Family XIII bacterium]|jgi:cell division protein FtsB|nr:septum formation initiator family protein [Clostridiales Family XIII bacterium]